MKDVRTFLLLAFFFGVANVQADVRLPAVISNNMVLQKDIPLPIWGWADPGERITVTIGKSVLTKTADRAGNWRVTLPRSKLLAVPMR